MVVENKESVKELSEIRLECDRVGWALACLGGCNPPALLGNASSTLAQRTEILRKDRCPTGSHKPGVSGSLPESAILHP